MDTQVNHLSRNTMLIEQASSVLQEAIAASYFVRPWSERNGVDINLVDECVLDWPFTAKERYTATMALIERFVKEEAQTAWANVPEEIKTAALVRDE